MILSLQVVICIHVFFILEKTADKLYVIYNLILYRFHQPACISWLFRISFRTALHDISNKLNMNEIITGVTLLTFGNSSSNLVTTLANFRSDTKMLYSQVFGKFLSGGSFNYASGRTG